MSDDLRATLDIALSGSFVIERELVGGGMSRIFVALDSALGRTVVVKVIAPQLAEGVSVERFAREVRLAARLQQANIVPVLSTGDASGLPYYMMPYVRGESLRARMTTGAPMPVGDAVNVLRDVARALAYAHEEHVVHRDIKPENILISGGAAVVTDFGIAKALSSSRTTSSVVGSTDTLTQIGTSIGTPAYMAPEQAAGDPSTDHRADLYAWGVVAWEMLAGRHPFWQHVTPHAVLAAHMGEVPAPLRSLRADVPVPLSAIVQRCLEKDPARRPASAAELLSALDQNSTPVPGVPPLNEPVFRRRWMMLAGTAMVLAGAAWFARNRFPATGGAAFGGAVTQKSVAVLPFESVGGDTANVYFAEGMADELTTALTKVDGLRVAAISSAFTYRNKTADVREVGKALNVATVLQGHVRRAGNRLRVSVLLTSVSGGDVLWSNSYEREAKDVFAVQDDLARDIVAALKVTLSGKSTAEHPSAGLRLSGTNDVEAHDLFLRGLFFLEQRGGGVSRSIDYFHQAIARDSNFARAWAELGTAYAVLPLFSFVPVDSAIGPARAAIARAIALDPASAEAYSALGISHLMASEWREALSDFERAIAFDSTYGFAHRGYTAALEEAGRVEDAAREARREIRLDPLSATAHAAAAAVLLNGRHVDEALRSAQRAVELDSAAPWPRVALALVQFSAGNHDEARRLIKGARRPPQGSPVLGYLIGALGDRAGALAFLHETSLERGHTAFYELTQAWTYMGLGDTTHALDALERAARNRDPVGFSVTFGMPMYDVLRANPRFSAVLRAYGMEPSAFLDVGRRH